MKPEYHEGPEAFEKFNRLATKVFKASKTIIKNAPKPPKLKRKKASKG